MKWSFSLEIKIRFRDIDVLGHINNAVYFTYIEQARSEYYSRLSGIRNAVNHDLIIASTKCDYKSTVSMDDELIVYVKPADIGRTSWKFKYEIREKKLNRLIAEAETVQVAFDYKKGKKKKIRNKLRNRLEEACK